MNVRLRVLTGLAALGTALVAAPAAAGSVHVHSGRATAPTAVRPGHAVNQPRPEAGKWAMHDPDGSIHGGTLRISKNRKYVKSVVLRGGCGSEMKVTGKFKIRPTAGFSGGRVWYIGKSSSSKGTHPYKVSWQVDGKSRHGYLRGAFSNKTHGYGDAGLNDGCTSTWDMHKHH